MLQATAKWKQAFESDQVSARLFVQIHVTIGGGTVEGTDVFSFCTGPELYQETPASISELSGLSQEINVATRALSSAQVTLKFQDDQALRDLIARKIYLKDKLCTIYLVTPGLAFSDALPIGQFIIDDLRSTTNNEFHLLLKDFRALAENATQTWTPFFTGWAPLFATPVNHKSTAGYPCQHPLENLANFLVTNAGVPGTFIGASLDPASWAGTIGHFNCSRFSNGADDANAATPYPDDDDWTDMNGGLPKTWNVRDQINEMEKILGGTLTAEPATDLSVPCQLQFKRYDPNASIVDTWSQAQGDIIELDIEESWTEFYNSFVYTGPSGLTGSKIDWVQATRNSNSLAMMSQFMPGSPPTFELRDIASMTRNQGPGNTSGVHSTDFSSEWLSGVSVAGNFGSGTGAINFDISHGPMMGVCGCRYDGLASIPGSYTGWTIPSYAVCSPSQPVYLRLTSLTDNFSTQQEIVRVTAIAAFATSCDIDDKLNYRPDVLACAVLAPDRALFGTTAIDWTGMSTGGHIKEVIYEDITIPVYLGTTLMDRANDGLVKLRVTTPIYKQPCQVGDLIAIDDPRGTVYGSLHIESTLTWEIIRKEVNLTSSSPHIQWLVALSSNPNAVAPTYENQENLWIGKP